jgi:phosphatidylglycerophosphate synthase
LPGTFTLALGALCFILVLRFYRELSGLIPAIGQQAASRASRRKIVYAMVALAILVPILFLTNGCGGATTTPAAQKSSIVTPSGTSTLVITPTATNASGKGLQLPLIQLTLTVN